MSLTKPQIQSIEETIQSGLRNRFKTYNPEPAAMPFHTRLLGKDRLALYSFIHSLITNFGTTIFEPVAGALAANQFKRVKTHTTSGTEISTEAQRAIQNIMDNLTTAHAPPNKKAEIEILRQVCKRGAMQAVKPTRVDIYLESENDAIYLIDLKTAKPNKGGFQAFKRTLLEWVAVTLAHNPQADVHTLIAIPYNPYAPKPYSRWTMAGMLDLPQELKVAREFWDFIGGNGAYADLLGCFERVGIALRAEIDAYFSAFNVNETRDQTAHARH